MPNRAIVPRIHKISKTDTSGSRTTSIPRNFTRKSTPDHTGAKKGLQGNPVFALLDNPYLSMTSTETNNGTVGTIPWMTSRQGRTHERSIRTTDGRPKHRLEKNCEKMRDKRSTKPTHTRLMESEEEGWKQRGTKVGELEPPGKMI